MTDHQYVELHPGSAQRINGHEPVIGHNATTGYARIHCQTCDWVGKGFTGRWHSKVEAEWRVHAGDLAMGVQIKHGTVGNGCHCATCAQATRAAAEVGTR